MSHAISTRRKGNETTEMDECFPTRSKWSGVLATCTSDHGDFHRLDRDGDDRGRRRRRASLCTGLQSLWEHVWRMERTVVAMADGDSGGHESELRYQRRQL